LELPPGDFIIVEVVQPGFLQSYPPTNLVVAPGLVRWDKEIGDKGYALPLVAGQTEQNLDFGNYLIGKHLLITLYAAPFDENVDLTRGDLWFIIPPGTEYYTATADNLDGGFVQMDLLGDDMHIVAASDSQFTFQARQEEYQYLHVFGTSTSVDLTVVDPPVPAPQDLMVVVPHDPADQPATVVVRRDGNDVIVVDQATGDELLRRQLDAVKSVVIEGSDTAADTLIVDLRTADPLTLPGGVEFVGGGDRLDRLSVMAPDGGATYRLDDALLSTPDIVVAHDGVEQFEITGSGGDDTYELSPTNKHIILNDSGGTDTLDFSSAASRIVLNLGRSAGQTQNVQGGGNTLALTGLFENVVGTPQGDSILGNTRNNVLTGGAGDDVLIGQRGRDKLDGGEGHDSIYAGPGRDFAWGGAGDDKIWGGGGNDVIDAGSGNDMVRAGRGIDIVRGGAGSDRLRGGNGNDVLLGGDGADLVHGGMGHDLVIGGSGEDVVEGAVHDDILIGGRTIHDEDNDALMAVIAEWGRDASIDERIDNLVNGGGRNGDLTLDAGSVLNDGVHDDLWGSYSTDWFITFSDDQLVDALLGRKDRLTEL
jgi:Ca2+-binding RTX toxin-like protein